MGLCVFFGHREYSESVDEKLYSVIKLLVTDKAVDSFYLGHNGCFDKAALRAVKRVAAEYVWVRYAVVLSELSDLSDKSLSTIFPAEVAEAPARFRIDRRNRFLLSKADYAVTYVKHPFGGASKYKALAIKKGIRVIEISEI